LLGTKGYVVVGGGSKSNLHHYISFGKNKKGCAA
jgi:hypothetical protein